MTEQAAARAHAHLAFLHILRLRARGNSETHLRRGRGTPTHFEAVDEGAEEPLDPAGGRAPVVTLKVPVVVVMEWVCSLHAQQ